MRILTCILLGTLLAATPAHALWGNAEGAFGLDGSIRSFAGYFDNRVPTPSGHSSDFLSQTILRLTATGRPNQRLSYEVHLVNTLTYSTAGVAGSVSGIDSSGTKTRYRVWDDAQRTLDEQQYWQGMAWLDRYNVKYAFDRFDLTVGRQAITFGKTWFWNPLDVFLPFDPNQFDRDYKPGVDAVRLDASLGDFSGLTFVVSPGRKTVAGEYVDNTDPFGASWYGSAALARYFTNVNGWDLAVQGGKIHGGWQFGGGVVGEIATVQVRAEAAYFWPIDSPPVPGVPYYLPLYEKQLTAVGGLGRHFESSLDVQFEFIYNAGGEDDQPTIGLLRQGAGALINASRWLAGATISYEFSPLLTGQIGVIRSLSDSSMQIQPILTYSLSDNADLLIGANINFGDKPTYGPFGNTVYQSEFGSYPNFGFMEIKWYF